MTYKNFMEIAETLSKEFKNKISDKETNHLIRFIPVEKGSILKNKSINLYFKTHEQLTEFSSKLTMKLIVDGYNQRQHGPSSYEFHCVDVFEKFTQVGQIIETTKRF